MNHTIITKMRAPTTQQFTTTIATIHYTYSIQFLPIDHNPRISYSQIHSPSGIVPAGREGILFSIYQH